MPSVYSPPFLLCPGQPVFGTHGISPPELHLDLSTPCLMKAALAHKVHLHPWDEVLQLCPQGSME